MGEGEYLFSGGGKNSEGKGGKYFEKISPKSVKDIEKSRFWSRSQDFCQFLEGFGIGFGKKSGFWFRKIWSRKKTSLKIKKAKQPQNEKRTISFKPRKVATPGTFIDTFEDLSDHDEGDKAFDEDVEEGDDNEAGDRNMNDGFLDNSSYEQELTENESTTLEDETLETL